MGILQLAPSNSGGTVKLDSVSYPSTRVTDNSDPLKPYNGSQVSNIPYKSRLPASKVMMCNMKAGL